MRRARGVAFLLLLVAGPGLWVPAAWAGDLPEWFSTVGISEGRAAFPKADLVVLLQENSVEIDADGRTRERIRVVYHLRRGSAGGSAAFRVPENSRSRAKSMRGWVGRDGKLVRDADEVIRTTLLNSALYSDCRDAILGLPDPAPGDLFGFEIEVETHFPGLRTQMCLGRGEEPVVRWSYALRVPAGWDCRGYWAETALSDTLGAPGTLGPDNRRTWIRESIAAPPEGDAWVLPPSESTPFFFVRYRGPTGVPALDSWPGVAGWYAEYARSALADTAGFAAFVREIAPPELEPMERARRIGEWVRANVGYAQVYLRDGEIRPHPVGETFRARYGDCKDMAHLCVGLLRAAGIRAWSVLASSGDRGVVRSEIPSPFFNHCITAIERPDGTLLFFDPTAKMVPFGRLPASLGGAAALVIDRAADAGLISLPESAPALNLASYHGILRFGARVATGELVVRYSGAAAWAWREILKSVEPALRTDRIRERLSQTLPGARVTGVDLPALEAVEDSLSLRIRFEAPLPGQRVGALVLLQPDFLTWESRTCLTDTTRRETNLGTPSRVETEAEIWLPAGWVIDDLPDSVRVENGMGLYERTCRGEGGVIRLRRVIENRVPRATPDEFPRVRDWGNIACRADRELATVRVP